MDATTTGNVARTARVGFHTSRAVRPSVRPSFLPSAGPSVGIAYNLLLARLCLFKCVSRQTTNYDGDPGITLGRTRSYK